MSNYTPNLFASLDLEMNQPSGKIIQIGLCFGDIQTGKIGVEFNWIINPKEEVTEYIENLTGITNERIQKEGKSLHDVYPLICEAYKTHRPFMNPLTWGGGDSQALREQLGIDKDQYFVFGRRWIDVKTVYQAYRHSKGESPRSGLAKSMVRLGIKFDGRKHDALDDAVNTFRVYHELLRRFRGGKE